MEYGTVFVKQNPTQSSVGIHSRIHELLRGWNLVRHARSFAMFMLLLNADKDDVVRGWPAHFENTNVSTPSEPDASEACHVVNE